LHAFRVDDYFAVAADIFFERYRFYPLEQIVESFGFETAKYYLYPVARTEI